MKLAPAKIHGFLSSPDPLVRVVLVYGPDAGLVRERVMRLAKLYVPDVNDPFRVVSLASSNLSSDSALLRDEMSSMSLGGGKRLVRIQNPPEACAVAIGELLADMPDTDSVLLIEGGDLDKRSKLRAVCEGESNQACAIACYAEDAAARQRTISDILASEKIRAAKEVVAILAEILPSDRMAMRAELEKFALYAAGGTKGADGFVSVSIEDVRASIQDAGAAETDDLVFAVGAGDAKLAAQLMDRLFSEQASPVGILRAAQRHFLRLQWARAQMDKGLGATDAVKRLQPPVFWKYESAMAAQVRRWSAVRIDRALRRLCDAEIAVKKTGTPDVALCSQVLLGLAA